MAQRVLFILTDVDQFPQQVKHISAMQRDKDFDLLHAQSVVRRPHLGELNSDRNLAAIDIAQFWLSTLIQGQITQVKQNRHCRADHFHPSPRRKP